MRTAVLFVLALALGLAAGAAVGRNKRRADVDARLRAVLKVNKVAHNPSEVVRTKRAINGLANLEERKPSEQLHRRKRWGLLKKLSKGIKKAARKVGAGVKHVARKVGSVAKSAHSKVVSFFRSSNKIHKIGSGVRSVVSGAKSFVRKVGSKVKSTGHNVGSLARKVVSKVKSAGRGVHGIGKKIKSKAHSVLKAGSVRTGIKKLVHGAGSVVKKVVSTKLGEVRGAVSIVRKALSKTHSVAKNVGAVAVKGASKVISLLKHSHGKSRKKSHGKSRGKSRKKSHGKSRGKSHKKSRGKSPKTATITNGGVGLVIPGAEVGGSLTVPTGTVGAEGSLDLPTGNIGAEGSLDLPTGNIGAEGSLDVPTGNIGAEGSLDLPTGNIGAEGSLDLPTGNIGAEGSLDLPTGNIGAEGSLDLPTGNIGAEGSLDLPTGNIGAEGSLDLPTGNIGAEGSLDLPTGNIGAEGTVAVQEVPQTPEVTAEEDFCRCKVNGDPHFRTFDGQMINFMGECMYTLSKSIDQTDPCAFNVEIKNEVRDGKTMVSWARLIDFSIYGLTVRLALRRKVYVNGLRKYPPFMGANGKLSVTINGQFVQVTTMCGIEVAFDGLHLVKVKVPKRYATSMTGLCGDCNGVEDDFRLSNGTDVSTLDTKFSQIGNSYLVFDNSDKPDNTDNCRVVEPDINCGAQVINQLDGPDKCGMIKDRSGPFAACINALSREVKEYYEACTFDACLHKDDEGEMQGALCKSLEAFASECEENGFNVKWRSANICPMDCWSNSFYNPEMSGCRPQCGASLSPTLCDLDPREGCECSAGYILSGEECVKQDDCGCVESGDYFPIGTKLSANDCSTVRECKKIDGVPVFAEVVVGQKCSANAMCGLFEGERKCACFDGFSGDGVTSCVSLQFPEVPPELKPAEVDPPRG
ncbi:uncharacterized protein LOC124286131 [Haliotis rubra]|uniref:uncharacterized protein LOC124286131 n=1 Tax=Haliotis rubra TaxID=36100 RepID=UPI001EE5396D|nr:uncharacterized protein LOC124286131 [Haliotis rubra]